MVNSLETVVTRKEDEKENRAMIDSVAELKNRTLVESNILKSFILSNSGKGIAP